MYNQPTINYSKRRKSRAIPDQSLTIQEIVKRYVRGVPVDVMQRTPVYVDQDQHDLEKLSRMDFGEKHEYANNLGQQAAHTQAELQQRQRSWELAKAKEAKAKEDAAKKPKVKKTTTT